MLSLYIQETQKCRDFWLNFYQTTKTMSQMTLELNEYNEFLSQMSKKSNLLHIYSHLVYPSIIKQINNWKNRSKRKLNEVAWHRLHDPFSWMLSKIFQPASLSRRPHRCCHICIIHCHRELWHKVKLGEEEKLTEALQPFKEKISFASLFPTVFLTKLVEGHQHGHHSGDKKIGEGGAMMGRAAPFPLAGHDSTHGEASSCHYML